MAEVRPGQEETLDIPADKLKRTNGFSFDIGGSVAKIAYVTKVGEDKVRIHFVSYPRDRLDEALQFLKDKSGGKLQAGETISSCGVGASQFQNKIDKELNIQVKNLSEMDCFVKAYTFLIQNVPLETIVHPPSEKTKKTVQEMLFSIIETTKKLKASEATSMTDWDLENRTEQQQSPGSDAAPASPEASANEQVVETASAQTTGTKDDNPEENPNFPTFLFMIGSGAAALKVIDENGKFTVVDGLTRAGRMFVGLGGLLTGATNFEELIDLASRGDAESLNVTGKHMRTDHGTVDVYSTIPDWFQLYSFGHAVGKSRDDFAPEDMAAALLSTIAQDLAQTLFLIAQIHKPKRVFFCGSFVGLSQTARDEIDLFFSMRSTMNMLGIKMEHYFLRYGGYLGALGALLGTLREEEVLTTSLSGSGSRT